MLFRSTMYKKNWKWSVEENLSKNSIKRIKSGVAVCCQRYGDLVTFSEVFEGKFRCKWMTKFLKRLKEGHKRFLDFKNLKLLKNI